MTGRTIPVTRTDDSEVAGEATQELIKAKTDNLDIALSALRDALRGTGGKTLTDLWDELASTLAVSDSASHTTLASILTALGPLATDAKLEAVRALLAGTLAMSAESLPLPSGAATSANQTTANTSLANILTALGLLATAAQLPASLGSKTAAGSLSVTGASDGVFYVGGVSADGVAPGNQAVRVSGIDGDGLKRTLLTDTSGRQYVVSPDSYSISSATALGALNDVYPVGGLALPSWARSAVFYTYGTFSAMVQYRLSFDGGASFVLCTASRNVSVAGGNASTGPGGIVLLELPPGATHIQVKCTSYTSGTAGILLAYSAAQVAPYTSGQIGALLSASNARVGCVFASGIWYDDTSSALTASSTFTSTARDITAANTGSTFASASTYAKEYRVMAEQDVAFTLQIQASRDNSAFRVVESITAAAVPGGGFVASTSVLPMWRYYRYAIVNGGTNAARTTGGSILMAI